MSDPIIHPGMKVAELLERWPELEAVLVAQAPAFQKLRNPVLRRTVARVATLEQAAGIAGISPRALVLALRRAAGQPAEDLEPAAPSSRSEQNAAGVDLTPPPAWLHASRIVRTIDADALLDAEETPLHAAFAAARALGAGEAIEVVASFRPVPLVEHLERQGFRCHLQAGTDKRMHLYVTPGDRR